ncbi:hypothetical protein UY3_03219 [Chelonia mydas]|uniref:Uncharacterized protein n=1 Tax=Chelonia mydas TaxID=8469 RepID=M7C564_CHEMY|nr:hypothetical protein UY3_03219 [Chelonia mydas]
MEASSVYKSFEDMQSASCLELGICDASSPPPAIVLVLKAVFLSTDIPMYSNIPSPTCYYEDIQTLDPKKPDLVVHQSPDRSPTFVKDVLSEEEELVEIQESDPHFEGLTSPDDSAGVTLASSHSDHVVIFYKLVVGKKIAADGTHNVKRNVLFHVT